MKKLLSTIQTLAKDLRAMTPKQRIEHIWYYFKWHIIIFLGCIIAAASLISSMLAQKESVLGGGFINISVSESGVEYLADEYLQVMEYNAKKQEVFLYDSGMTGMSADQMMQNPNLTISFMTMIGAKKFDYLLMDEVALNHYKEQGLFMDLHSVFSADFLQSNEHLLIYSDTYDEDGNALGQLYPVGICIDAIPFATEHIESDAPVYLAFARNAVHPEKLAGFYDYLCSWKPGS